MSLDENRRIALQRDPGTIRECYCGATVWIEDGKRYEFNPSFDCFVTPVEHHCLTAEVAAPAPKPSRDMSRDDVTVSEPVHDNPSEGFVMPARTHQE